MPGSSNGLFPPGFPIKTLSAPLLSPIHATCPACLTLLNLVSQIFDEQNRSLRPSFSTHHLVPLRPEYPPQHPILKHPQPTFLPQCKRTSFMMPLQNNRQNYSSVYLNLHIFGQQTGRQNILHQRTACIPLLQFAPNFFLNRILIHQGFSQILQMFHPNKGTIINLYIVTSSCILTPRHDHVLSSITISTSL